MGRNLRLCLWILSAKEVGLEAWQRYRQAEKSLCLAARQEGRNRILESCSIRLLRCTVISLYVSSGHLAFCGPLFHLSLGVNKKASCEVSAGNGLLDYSPLQLFPVYTEQEATDLTLDTQDCPGISFCWSHQQASPFLREQSQQWKPYPQWPMGWVVQCGPWCAWVALPISSGRVFRMTKQTSSDTQSPCISHAQAETVSPKTKTHVVFAPHPV